MRDMNLSGDWCRLGTSPFIVRFVLLPDRQIIRSHWRPRRPTAREIEPLLPCYAAAARSFVAELTQQFGKCLSDPGAPQL